MRHLVNGEKKEFCHFPLHIFLSEFLLSQTAICIGINNTTFKTVQGVYNAMRWLADTLGLLFLILEVAALPAILRFQTKECSMNPAVECEPETEKDWCPTGYTSPLTFPCVPKHFHVCVLCSVAKMAVNVLILQRKYILCFNCLQPVALLRSLSTNVKMLSLALTW